MSTIGNIWISSVYLSKRKARKVSLMSVKVSNICVLTHDHFWVLIIFSQKIKYEEQTSEILRLRKVMPQISKRQFLNLWKLCQTKLSFFSLWTKIFLRDILSEHRFSPLELFLGGSWLKWLLSIENHNLQLSLSNKRAR